MGVLLVFLFFVSILVSINTGTCILLCLRAAFRDPAGSAPAEARFHENLFFRPSDRRHGGTDSPHAVHRSSGRNDPAASVHHTRGGPRPALCGSACAVAWPTAKGISFRDPRSGGSGPSPPTEATVSQSTPTHSQGPLGRST